MQNEVLKAHIVAIASMNFGCFDGTYKNMSGNGNKWFGIIARCKSHIIMIADQRLAIVRPHKKAVPSISTNM